MRPVSSNFSPIACPSQGALNRSLGSPSAPRAPGPPAGATGGTAYPPRPGGRPAGTPSTAPERRTADAPGTRRPAAGRRTARSSPGRTAVDRRAPRTAAGGGPPGGRRRAPQGARVASDRPCGAAEPPRGGDDGGRATPAVHQRSGRRRPALDPRRRARHLSRPETPTLISHGAASMLADIPPHGGVSTLYLSESIESSQGRKTPPERRTISHHDSPGERLLRGTDPSRPESQDPHTTPRRNPCSP